MDVTITLTNDELSILKQLLRKSGDEFSELKKDKPRHELYKKIMQTRKGGK